MPVDPRVPEPLKTALEDMEMHVQKCKESLAFAAPEAHDLHWIVLQGSLAQTIVSLTRELETAPSAGSSARDDVAHEYERTDQ
jgi:hypothetical protein